MTRYFYKECFSTYYFVAGAPVPFEQLDGNRGVAVFDTEKDAALIAALDKAAGEGKGGIVRLTEAGYNEKKNKPLSPKLNLPSRTHEEIRVMPHDLSPHPKGAEVAANGKSAGAAPDPNIGADGLRLDGPTLEEFVATGFPPAGYPPRGYAIRTVPRWKEAGLKAPPKDEDEAPLPSIPRPDPVISKEQGQGSTDADKIPSNKTPEPTKPAFKPATKRLGQEKANAVPAVGAVGAVPKPTAATEEPIDSEKDKTKTGNVG